MPPHSALVLRGGSVSSSSVALGVVGSLISVMVARYIFTFAVLLAQLYKPPNVTPLDPDSWGRLRRLLSGSGPADVREEAAKKLIMNHEAVLRDITNPLPRSQLELKRLPWTAATHIDRALHEVASRLLGCNTHRTPSSERQAAVWAATAQFLSKRLQATTEDAQRNPPEMRERKPDMSVGAAEAMRTVLADVGQTSVGSDRQASVGAPMGAAAAV